MFLKELLVVRFTNITSLVYCTIVVTYVITKYVMLA